jgi:hypothetical protein
MAHIPPPPPFRLNVDRHGMPRDFATYMWVTYRRVVDDRSPARRAFLAHGPQARPSLGPSVGVR